MLLACCARLRLILAVELLLRLLRLLPLGLPAMPLPSAVSAGMEEEERPVPSHDIDEEKDEEDERTDNDEDERSSSLSFGLHPPVLPLLSSPINGGGAPPTGRAALGASACAESQGKDH